MRWWSARASTRLGDYTLTEFYENGRTRLYNLRADIGEQHDLAVRMQDKAAELWAMLHEWREQVGALMPTPNLSARK